MLAIGVGRRTCPKGLWGGCGQAGSSGLSRYDAGMPCLEEMALGLSTGCPHPLAAPALSTGQSVAEGISPLRWDCAVRARLWGWSRTCGGCEKEGRR